MISVVTCTGRTDPGFATMADTIASNLHSLNVTTGLVAQFEWLVIDMKLWGDDGSRRKQLEAAVHGRFAFAHHAPKPNTWQGPHRLGQHDIYALCNARNTGIVLAKNPHIILFDDCMAAGPMWLMWHFHAAQRKIAMAGSYISVHDLTLNNGAVVDTVPLAAGNEDHRLALCTSPLPTPCSGAWMYGLNISFPREAALNIDGFDEMYDGQGGVEDCSYGIRLERSGCPIYFAGDCNVFQILKHHDAVCGNAGLGILDGKQSAKPKERMLGDGRMHYANEWLITQLLTDIKRIQPYLQRNLRQMNPNNWPIPTEPTVDWRDGQPIKDM